ncbi:MAG: OmpH family outer membrane protein [Chlamydiales bacterium]|nr:OmpH family outer membrane protein [Chlamydiales bacterium]
MKKIGTIVTAFALVFCVGKLTAEELTAGFVNFKTCVEKSKHGQQERNAFEAMKKQMTEVLEKTDKELEQIAKKLEDQDYMDGLSPAAEAELKQKFQGLSQDFARYQNQYYQLLNQANYKMLQTMHDEVSLAAEQIRERKKLSLILNEDSTFAFAPSLDFTDEVIKEMDKQFEIENSSGSVAKTER